MTRVAMIVLVWLSVLISIGAFILILVALAIGVSSLIERLQ